MVSNFCIARMEEETREKDKTKRKFDGEKSNADLKREEKLCVSAFSHPAESPFWYGATKFFPFFYAFIIKEDTWLKTFLKEQETAFLQKIVLSLFSVQKDTRIWQRENRKGVERMRNLHKCLFFALLEKSEIYLLLFIPVRAKMTHVHFLQYSIFWFIRLLTV